MIDKVHGSQHPQIFVALESAEGLLEGYDLCLLLRLLGVLQLGNEEETTQTDDGAGNGDEENDGGPAVAVIAGACHQLRHDHAGHGDEHHLIDAGSRDHAVTVLRLFDGADQIHRLVAVENGDADGVLDEVGHEYPDVQGGVAHLRGRVHGVDGGPQHHDGKLIGTGFAELGVGAVDDEADQQVGDRVGKAGNHQQHADDCRVQAENISEIHAHETGHRHVHGQGNGAGRPGGREPERQLVSGAGGESLLIHCLFSFFFYGAQIVFAFWPYFIGSARQYISKYSVKYNISHVHPKNFSFS